jgi:putative transposase
MSARRLTYTTDLTDGEWHILEPLLPPEKTGGRPRKYPRREVLNGIQYVLRAGCAWRLMPHDLPHWQTAYQTVRAWRQDGRGSASTISSALRSAPVWDATHNPRPLSSMRKRSKPPKKGGPRLRRGEES